VKACFKNVLRPSILYSGCIIRTYTRIYIANRENESEAPLFVFRSTQPCIRPGSLNRVPASAGVKAGMSPLPGGR